LNAGSLNSFKLIVVLWQIPWFRYGGYAAEKNNRSLHRTF